VEKLTDIRCGQEVTKRVLNEFHNNPNAFKNDIISPLSIKRYFDYYYHERKNQMYYPVEKKEYNLFNLLSLNEISKGNYQTKNGQVCKLLLPQSFKTANEEFCVIDENTISVIVPFCRKGKKIVARIKDNKTLKDMKKLLKQAQRYTINMYQTEFNKFRKMGAIQYLNIEMEIYELSTEYYDKSIGLTENRNMQNLIIGVKDFGKGKQG
jgi:CRISPR-associated endonuclease/helicase Cas3